MLGWKHLQRVVRSRKLRALILLAGVGAASACSGTLVDRQAPPTAVPPASLPPYASVGAKAGEVEATTAVIQTYLTDRPTQELLAQPYEERQYETKPAEACVEYSTVELSDLEPASLTEDEFARYRREKSDSHFTPWLQTPQELTGVSNQHDGAERKQLQQARATDSSIHVRLEGLQPATRYSYRLWTRSTEGETVRASRAQEFRTAPPAEEAADIDFIVSTCFNHGKMKDLAEGSWPAKGFRMYRALLDLLSRGELRLDFAVINGDTVYLDKQGSNYRRRPDFSVEGVRARYLDTYVLPLAREFFGRVPAYFEKDDHDWRFNDADPVFNPAATPRRTYWRMGKYYRGPPGPLLGKEVFEEMHPVGRGPEARPYRTFRWGRGLQIWLLEARECRYPNTRKLSRYGIQGLTPPEAGHQSPYLHYPKYCGTPSSEELWGPKQFAWLTESLKKSDATFKIIISPTPVLGPDQALYLSATGRPLEYKTDNHVFRFRAEFARFLEFLRRERLRNVYIVSGDRHFVWHSRYESKDGTFALDEFGCGPFADDLVSFGDRLYKDEEGEARVLASAARAGVVHIQVKNVAKRPSLKVEWYVMEDWEKPLVRRWEHTFEAEASEQEAP